MRSNLLFWLIATTIFCITSHAAIPGDKRTILTSGEKVYTIRYQLGQSTILYFGLKPETVICGNKNYFNIEKIKDGITIQPLSNFSTNLTVISENRRYLFYLTPAGGVRPDGFVDVKWVPASEAKPVKPLAGHAAEVSKVINYKMKLVDGIELTVLKEVSIENGKRRMFDLELKNMDSKTLRTQDLEIVAALGTVPVERQVTVWEADELARKKTVKGRLIVSNAAKKSINLVMGFRGKSKKIPISGGGR